MFAVTQLTLVEAVEGPFHLINEDAETPRVGGFPWGVCRTRTRKQGLALMGQPIQPLGKWGCSWCWPLLSVCGPHLTRRLGEEKLCGCEEGEQCGRGAVFCSPGDESVLFWLEALSWDGERWLNASTAHPVPRADMANRSQHFVSVRGLPLLTSACQVAQPINQNWP